MSDIPDLWQATADAIYARLDTALVGTPVFQALDEGQQPPFVLVGDMDGKPVGGKYEVEDEITIDVQFVTRTSRRDLLALMWAARRALQDEPLTADGVSFSPVGWVSGDTATGPDGVTRAGIHQFTVVAEPA